MPKNEFGEKGYEPERYHIVDTWDPEPIPLRVSICRWCGCVVADTGVHRRVCRKKKPFGKKRKKRNG
jgi:hypothetical protein